MSYIDKNPFNRPSPSFGGNTNLTPPTNFYSNIDSYSIGRTSDFNYQTPNQGYFGTNQKAQSQQYKYSRAVQDSPFLSGSNPFATSIAGKNINKSYDTRNYGSLVGGTTGALNNYDFSSSKVGYTNNQNYPDNDTYSYKKRDYASYEPRISEAIDPYEKKYFQVDKYDNKFRKSNFQTEFDVQLGRARQNDADIKYKRGTQEKQISKILSNNPFQNRTSLQKTNTNYNKYSSSVSGGYNQLQTSNAYRKQPLNKYEQLQFKPSYLATSNVNSVAGFGLNDASPRYSYDNKYDKLSQNDSGNTFINKFDDIISSQQSTLNKAYNKYQINGNNYSQRLSQYENISAYSKEGNNQIVNGQISNPFKRDSNPFVRDSTPFNNKIDIHSKGVYQINSLQEEKKSFDNQDLYKKVDNQNKYQDDNDKKYQQFIFKRSTTTNKEDQVSSQKNYNLKVDEQFQIWGRQSKKSRSSSNPFDMPNQQPLFQYNYQSKKGNQVQTHIKSKEVLKKDSINTFGYNQSSPQNQMKQSLKSANFKFPSFMKQSSQKDPSQRHQKFEINLPYTNQYKQTKKSMSEYDYKIENKDKQRNTLQFRFSGQDFNDSQEETLKGNINYVANKDSFQKKSMKLFSQEDKIENLRGEQPSFNKKPSQASLNQYNTEQKLDQKLDKFRYTYEKREQKNTGLQKVDEQIKLNDFIDLSIDQFGQNDSYHEQQSFQVVRQQNNQLLFLNGPQIKRPSLKTRLLNDSRNQSFEQQPKENILPIPISSKNKQKQLEFQKTIIRQIIPEQKYQFKTMQDFQKEYNIKTSGFDFEEDQFEDSEKRLEMDQNDIDFRNQNNQNKNKSSKVLVAQYGYQQEDQQHIPSFKIKESMIKDEKKLIVYQLSKGIVNKTSKDKYLPTQTHQPSNKTPSYTPSRRQNIQQKVQRMKIYQSQSQPYRSSGQYEAVDLNKHKKYLTNNKTIEQQSETQNYSKSPFQRKGQTKAGIKKDQITVNIRRQKKQVKKQIKYKSNKSQKSIIDEVYQLSQNTQSEDQFYQEELQQNLKQTKKNSIKSKNKQRKSHSSIEEPVRDSFDFSNQTRTQKNNKNKKQNDFGTPKFNRKPQKDINQKHKSYPTLLEFKGNIYHLIDFV